MDLSGEPGKELTAADVARANILRNRATELIKSLAQKTSLPEVTLMVIGRNLYEDAVVNFIWNLWFDEANLSKEADHQERADGPPSGHERP